MKKISFAVLFFALVSSLLFSATAGQHHVASLAGNIWKFKNVTSENPATANYLKMVYDNATFSFAINQTYQTYTGTFFAIPINGTWELLNNTLILNKGTHKEETFALAQPTPDNFILQSIEKGNTVFIEFERE